MSNRLAPGAYVFERRWLPSPDGSLTLPSPWTNVPRHVDGASPFDWATTGRGAYDLALNVLEDVLRSVRHEGPTATHAGKACFTLSLILRDACVEQFIARIPDEGGTLPRRVIEAWIAEQEGALDPLLAEVLAPRFTAAEGYGPWTAAELQEIRGEPPTMARLIADNGTPAAAALSPHPLDSAEWETCPL